MYVRWDPRLDTGQALIDAEHRLLIFMFRKLDIAIKSRADQASIGYLIQEVQRAVQFHFTSEENLMRETAYPGLLEHQSLHQELLASLNAAIAKISAHREFPEDLLSFLNDWLWAHIAKEDRELVAHVKASKLRPVGESEYADFQFYS